MISAHICATDEVSSINHSTKSHVYIFGIYHLINIATKFQIYLTLQTCYMGRQIQYFCTYIPKIQPTATSTSPVTPKCVKHKYEQHIGKYDTYAKF